MAGNFFNDLIGATYKGMTGLQSLGINPGSIGTMLGGSGGLLGSLLGGGGDGSSSPTVTTMSTMNPAQQKLFQQLIQTASQNFKNFQPFMGPTVQTSPTSGQQAIFDEAKKRVGQSGPAPGSSSLQKAGAAAPGGSAKPSQGSPTDIIFSGYTSILRKLLEQL